MSKSKISIFATFIILCVMFCFQYSVSAEDVMIDNGGEGYMEIETLNPGTGGIGGTHKIGKAGAKYSPVLEDGVYSVSINVPTREVNYTNCFGIVKHSEGITEIDLATFDLKETGWYEIGTFKFREGEEMYFQYITKGDTAVRCDAVKFTYIDEIDETVRVLDCDESKYIDAIKFMTTLGIMDVDASNNFQPQKEVTREEIAKIIYILHNIDNIPTETSVSSLPFYDVNPDSEYAYYINYVNQMKYMTGYGDYQFRPKQKLLYGEAVKVMMSTLGFDILAAQKNGYPDGYMYWARNEKIDIGLAVSDYITKEELAQLIFNSLETEIMGVKSFGSNMEYGRGNLLMKELLEIEEVEGIVEQDGYTSLTRYDGFEQNKVKINNVIYDNIGKESYLGYYVTAYVSYKNNDEGEVVHIQPKKNRNKICEFYSEDIISATINTIVYDDGSDTETVKLETGFDLIYNGKAKLDYTADDLKCAYGKVKLIDNDRNGQYEIVMIEELTYKQIARANLQSGTIYFTDNSYIKVEGDRDEYSYLFTSDGNTKGLKSLKADAILGYADDGEFIILRQITKKTEGVFTEYSDDRVTINGQEYVMANNLRDIGVYLNTKVIAYFDDHDKVAAISKELLRTNEMYAYVVKSAYSDSEEKFYIKLYDQSGMENTYEFEEIRLNGRKHSADEVSSFINNGDIIKIILNDEGELKRIETANDKSEVIDYDGYTENEFTKDYSILDTRFIGNPQNSFGGKFIMNNNTVCFFTTIKRGEEVVEIIDRTKLVHYNQRYNVSLYDCDNELNIGVALISIDGSLVKELTKNTASYVVKRIYQKLDEYDEVVACAELWGNGKTCELILPVDEVPNNNVFYLYNQTKYPDLRTGNFKVNEDVMEGDIIQFTQNSDGEIDNLVVLFRPSLDILYSEKEYVESGKTASNKNNNYQILWTGYGKVSKIFDERFLITTDNTNNWIRNIVPSSNIYITNGRGIFEGTYNDIDIGDDVFVHNVYQNNSIIYIIKQ